jgi:L-fuculose-phosphate aldolase
MNLKQIKSEICEIGRRLYQKGFAAANDGNISYRLSEKKVLCTPAMICKGFMKPGDLCIVDMSGNQLAGKRRRTTEILLHLAILRERPDVIAVVHCHPPHATAFAMTGEPIPQGISAEMEILLPSVPMATYATTGTQACADSVLPHVHSTNAILLANHGTVTYWDTIERAYWLTEVLDAYCQMVLLARGLGSFNYLTARQKADLREIRRKLGFKDADPA